MIKWYQQLFRSSSCKSQAPGCVCISWNIDLIIGRIRDIYLYLHEQLRRACAVHEEWHKVVAIGSFQGLEGELLDVRHGPNSVGILQDPTATVPSFVPARAL